MTKYVLAALCGFAAAGIGYRVMAAEESCPACDATVVLLADATTATAPATQAAVDVKNTKCMVMAEDDGDGPTTIYKGKIYHFCCSKCVKTFEADPEKYVKALEAEPGKYGVGK